MNRIAEASPARLLAALLLAALLAGCGRAAPPAPAAPAGLPANVAVSSELTAAAGGPPQAGEAAPDFRFQMAGGGAQSLSGLRGRRVVVNFWATWCAPCKEEMPALQRLAGEYGDALAVVGVNKLELPEVIGPFAKELGVSFTLVANPSGDISDRYGAKNIPLTYFVNSDGTVGSVSIGVLDYDAAKRRIEELR